MLESDSECLKFSTNNVSVGEIDGLEFRSCLSSTSAVELPMRLSHQLMGSRIRWFANVGIYILGSILSWYR
jgi:hypothetical protein